MEIIEKRIAARLQRPHADGRLGTGGDYLLEVHLVALDFGSDGAGVLDPERDGLPGRRVQLCRIKTMILNFERKRHGVIGARRHNRQDRHHRAAQHVAASNGRPLLMTGRLIIVLLAQALPKVGQQRSFVNRRSKY